MTEQFIRAPESGPADGVVRAWAVTLLLAALSLISFLDRQVLAVILSSIRADLAITDIEVGWLIGPAFFIVYNLTLLPAALIVDKWNRKWLVVIGVLIWSVLTIASGFAQSYTQLLAMRGGVAFGEALLGPAAISLIGDLFTRDNRPLPTATYIIGSTIGSTGSAMISAAVLQLASAVSGEVPALASLAPWRLTLVGVGLPGILLAILLLVVGREPRRNVEGREEDAGQLESVRDHLGRRGTFYARALIGLSLLLMNMSSIGLWAPTFLVRNFALTEVQSGYWIGIASLVGGVAGAFLLPAIVRKLLRERRIDAMVGLVVLAMIGAVISAVAGGMAQTLPVAAIGFGLFMFFAGAAGTMPTLIVQLYVPAHMRGRASAVTFFLLYLLAFGVAPVLVPSLAGALFGGAAGLGKSLALVACVSGVAAVLLFASTLGGFRSGEQEART